MPVTTGDAASDATVRGDGRTLAVPAFPDDDGRADPRLRERLAADGPGVTTARRLRSARLLASVVAVADEVDADGADTSSHMAVVSMLNERGERGLLAFTGVDSLAAWNPEARPVPALGRDMARSALDDGAGAVVIDVAGPVRTVIGGLDLQVLADTLDLGRVSPVVEAALAPLTADGWVEVQVRDARAESDEVDLLVTLSVRGGAHPDGRSAQQLATRAAEVLGARQELGQLVPGGLGVAIDQGDRAAS